MTSTNEDSSHQAIYYLSSLGFRVLVNTLAHPLEYAKVLIQIGHEPLPPYPTKSFFGKRVYALPNVFRYVKYIKAVDGYSGCYRGFTPRITAQIVGTFALRNATKKFEFKEDFDANEDEMSEEEKRTHFLHTLTQNVVGRTASIIASHPFHVIAIRMMAQFVGGEEKYSGMVASVVEIYREQGVCGFFAGLLPRWLGEMATLIIASTVTFALSSYIIQDKELKSFTAPTIQYITSAFTYPFTVVSSCMAVNDCGLAAGLPPNMPIYKGWTDSWHHLSKNSQLNRGSSLLWRYYFGPTATIDEGKFILAN